MYGRLLFQGLSYHDTPEGPPAAPEMLGARDHLLVSDDRHRGERTLTSLNGPVGVRNRTQQVNNAVGDQAKIIALLSLITPANGGKLGVWTPPLPDPSRRCPPLLAEAIRSFQEVWRTRGELRTVDGVIDPGGGSLRKLDALVGSGVLVGPGGIDPSIIRFRQTNPQSRTDVRSVIQKVISPLSIGGLFQEVAQSGSIREFLFEMRNDGAIYWIGAAVPEGTSDFSCETSFHA